MEATGEPKTSAMIRIAPCGQNTAHIVTGQPICELEETKKVIEQFVTYRTNRGWTPVFYGVSETFVPLFAEMFWSSMKIAEETILSPSTWSITGKKRRQGIDRPRSRSHDRNRPRWPHRRNYQLVTHVPRRHRCGMDTRLHATPPGWHEWSDGRYHRRNYDSRTEPRNRNDQSLGCTVGGVEHSRHGLHRNCVAQPGFGTRVRLSIPSPIQEEVPTRTAIYVPDVCGPFHPPCHRNWAGKSLRTEPFNHSVVGLPPKDTLTVKP